VIKSNEPRIYENNEILKQTLSKVIPLIQNALDRIIFINIMYSDGRSGNTTYPGMRYIVNLRGKQNDTTPILFYGFEKQEHLKKKPDASILNSDAVEYIQMPFELGRLSELIDKLLNIGKIGKPLDDQTEKTFIVKEIRDFLHKCSNAATYLSVPINDIRDAGDNHSVIKQKIQLVRGFGVDFISEKLKLYKSIRDTLENNFKRTNGISRIPVILKYAEDNYKVIYKESGKINFNKDSIKCIITKADEVIKSLKEIEDIFNE